MTRDGPAERAAKRFVDGTHRACAPEETFERVRPHLSAVGITRVADISGLDRIPISTVIAHRPNSRTLAAGSGKGYSKIAATVSATMEAIELHHAEYADLEVERASHDELAATENVIAIDKLALTSHNIFAAHRPEQWVEGWDLIGQRSTWVPLNSVDMGSNRRDAAWSAGSFQVGSNGLASGNVMLEATLAGVYEVVERDAITCWWLAQLAGAGRSPRVDPATIDDPLPLDLIDRLEAADIAVEIDDCTVETRIPTYVAKIQGRHGELGHYHGMGTHLDPAIAMVRAIAEAVQGRVLYVAGSRDDLFDHRRHLVNRVPGRRAHEARESLPRPPAVAATRWHHAPTHTFEDDLAIVVDRLRTAGVDQVIVVDLTRSDLGIPVVRVVIPGFEGYPFPHYEAGNRGRAFVETMRRASSEAATAP